MSTAPEQIWLQRDEDDTRHPRETEGVTWCEDKINDTDTEYMRADIARNEITRLRDTLTEIATAYYSAPEILREKARVAVEAPNAKDQADAA